MIDEPGPRDSTLDDTVPEGLGTQSDVSTTLEVLDLHLEAIST